MSAGQSLSIKLACLLAGLLCLLGATRPAVAADLQVTVTVSKKRLTVSETLTLTIAMKGNGIEHLRLPELFPPSFTVIDQSDKPSLSQDAFGHPVSGRVLRFQLQPTVGGKFRLGGFTVRYNGEERRFNGEIVEVIGPHDKPSPANRTDRPDRPDRTETESERPVPIPSGPIDVRLSAEVDRNQVYVGERILLSIRITHNSAEVSELKPTDTPEFADFWNREVAILSPHISPRDITINGRPYATVLIPRFVLYPTTSGQLTIPALTYSMLARPQFGMAGKPMTLKTAPITIEAKPLPEDDKPASFRGAVGHCQFSAKLQDRVTQVGVPTKLMIQIDTDGNVESLTPPPLPTAKDLKFYALNRVTVKNEEDKPRALATWEAEVVPTAAGQLTIPPINFAYFDPTSESYQVIESETLQLEVSASAPSGETNPTTSSPFSRFFMPRWLRYLLPLLLLMAGIALAVKFGRRPQLVTAGEPLPERSPATVEKRSIEEQKPVAPEKPPERPLPKPAPKPAPKPEPKPAVKAAAKTVEIAAQTSAKPPTLSNEVNKLVNSAYGKLHRGDERAYAKDLLKALRMIFDSGFGIPSSELTLEQIAELLTRRGASQTLNQQTTSLYQECEQLCFSPVACQHAPNSERDYARYQAARRLIDDLIRLI